VLQEREAEEYQKSLIDELNNEIILHRAVGIIRQQLAYVENLDQEYSPDEISTEYNRRTCVNPLIYKVICWISNKDAFKKALDEEIQTDKKILQVNCSKKLQHSL